MLNPTFLRRAHRRAHPWQVVQHSMPCKMPNRRLVRTGEGGRRGRRAAGRDGATVSRGSVVLGHRDLDPLTFATELVDSRWISRPFQPVIFTVAKYS